MSFLPSASTGYLPYFLLLGSAAGSYNALQTHVSQWQTKEIYGKTPDQVNALTARLFGVYTLVVSLIRGYAAYNIHIAPIYDLAVLVHLVALCHFTVEMTIFGTVKLNRASFFPFVMSTTGLIWTLSQRSHYLGL